jgi:hypothetical protein
VQYCTIHPTTDAKVLFMPTRKLMLLLLTDDPNIGDAALIEEMRWYAFQYVEYHGQGRERVMTLYCLDSAKRFLSYVRRIMRVFMS